MVVAAEFGTGQVVWSILWFFLFFMWIWLVISVFADIIRNRDMSGGAKAIWTIVIIFLPFLGVFVYMLMHGDSMAERQVQDAQAQDEAFRSYVRDAAGTSSSADQLATLAELHSSGKIDDAEYAAAKAKVIS